VEGMQVNLKTFKSSILTAKLLRVVLSVPSLVGLKPGCPWTLETKGLEFMSDLKGDPRAADN